jgi:hypothetical protein
MKEEEEEIEEIPAKKQAIPSQSVPFTKKSKPNAPKPPKLSSMNVFQANIPPFFENTQYTDHGVVQRTKDTLYKKMEEYHAQIANIKPGPSSYLALSETISLIKELAEAISALEDIRIPQ